MRAGQVLKCLGDSGYPLGISQISEKLDMSPSTVYRVLSALEEEGLVEQDSETRKYGISIRLFAIGRVALRHMGLGPLARAELVALSQSLGETVYLGVLREDRVIYVQSVESKKTLRTAVKVTSDFPAHTTAIGKVIMAYSSQEEIEEYIRNVDFKPYTPGSIASPKIYRERLREIQEKGYTFDDEECAIGVRAVGAPIRNVVGEVIAGIALTAPSSRFKDEMIPKVVNEVVETARVVSRLLGWIEDETISVHVPVSTIDTGSRIP
jgi:IclR family KDG regulon transcriptional repressor